MYLGYYNRTTRRSIPAPPAVHHSSVKAGFISRKYHERGAKQNIEKVWGGGGGGGN